MSTNTSRRSPRLGNVISSLEQLPYNPRPRFKSSQSQSQFSTEDVRPSQLFTQQLSQRQHNSTETVDYNIPVLVFRARTRTATSRTATRSATRTTTRTATRTTTRTTTRTATRTATRTTTRTRTNPDSASIAYQ